MAANRLAEVDLQPHRSYRYLRIPKTSENGTTVRDNPAQNADKFREIEKALTELDFTADQLKSIYEMTAVILLLGELRYKPADETSGRAGLENPEIAVKVCKLLKVDEKKFTWALVNYCVINSGKPEKRRHSVDEAREARDNLASILYCRLVDWITAIVNQKLSLGRAI